MMLMAVAIPIIMGMVGLAIDAGNLYMAHSRLQAAVDAGALAGSMQLPYDPNLTQGIVVRTATDMVEKNYPEAEVASVVPGKQVRSVCVNGEVTVPSMLMGSLGIASTELQATACAGFNHLEIALVIDNSGSMRGTPIEMVKQAAGNLVELIMPDGTAPDTKVGLVAFRGKVRIGANVDGLPAGCRNADGSVNSGLNEKYMPLYWKLPSYYRSQVSMDTCSDLPEVLALSTHKDNILTAINGQTATGEWSGTVISEGMKWGREVLTPEAPYTEGESADKLRKIMIVLTDGDTEDGMCGGSYAVSYTPNNYWTNAYYGMGDDKTHCENGGGLNQAMLDEAKKAKDAGIEIFSIRYGYSDTVDKQLMKSIASNADGTEDHYFDAPSAYDFDEIFKQIGQQLGWRLLN